MKTAKYFIGIYQIITSIIGLTYMGPVLMEMNYGYISTFILLSSLSFISGLVLLLSERIGWKISLIAQMLQAVSVSTPIVNFVFSLGLSLRPYFGLMSGGDSIMDARMAMGFYSRFGADLGVTFGQVLPGFLTYGVYVNIVAVITTYICFKGVKSSRKTTCKLATDSAQEVEQVDGD